MTFRDDVEAELANPIDRPVGAGSRDGRDGESEPASPCVVKPGREALVETWQACSTRSPCRLSASARVGSTAYRRAGLFRAV